MYTGGNTIVLNNFKSEFSNDCYIITNVTRYVYVYIKNGSNDLDLAYFSNMEILIKMILIVK